MIKNQSLITLLMYYIVFHTYIDAWNNIDKHKIVNRRQLWQSNDNGSVFSATAKRKWESLKFLNNRIQIAREKRRELDCSLNIISLSKKSKENENYSLR